MSDIPKLLTTGEAAEALRVSGTTIRRMLKRGDLVGFSRAGIGRVTVDSVKRLLNIEPVGSVEEEVPPGVHVTELTAEQMDIDDILGGD